MRVLLTIGLTGGLVGGLTIPAQATDLNLKIEIPRLEVAEYHRPYLAVWLERPDQSVAANLAVWYDLKQKNNDGTKWLKDLRQWWRRVGRELVVPADGLTGATRPPGEHTLSFRSEAKPLADLPAGEYQLIVEAAREVGGRELLRLPVQWPPRPGEVLKAQGQHELGAITVEIKP